MVKRHMPVIVELSIIPIGVGLSLSRFIAPALLELEKLRINYEVTPMCTIFEAEDVDEAFEVVKAAYKAVIKSGVKRVVVTVKFDDRRDVKMSMQGKVESLLKKMEWSHH